MMPLCPRFTDIHLDWSGGMWAFLAYNCRSRAKDKTAVKQECIKSEASFREFTRTSWLVSYPSVVSIVIEYMYLK